MADLDYNQSAQPVQVVDEATGNALSITAAGGLKIDGSGTALPVSGAVTANAGTNLNTSALALDATLTGGTQKTKLVDTGGTNVASISAAGAVKVDGSAVTQPVSGTFFQATQPVSAASLPLPAGAATEAKQPALGTAGTPSADVITIQGVTSMTALKVDGSAVTQPVSGTVTANAGTNLNTSLLALESTQVKTTIAQGAALGTNTQTMVGGSVTAAAPTYTTGEVRPLSIDTAGSLRVTGGGVAQGSTTSGQSGTLIQGAVTTAAPTYTTAQTSPLSLDTNGSLRTTVVDFPTYMASTNGIVVTGTTAATVTSIAYLWHPAAITKRYEIVRIQASWSAGISNSGNFNIRLAKITAENATPGGTPQTINTADGADAASGGTFRTGATGAPTRTAGDLSAFEIETDTGNANSGSLAYAPFVIFDAFEDGKPLVCRSGVAEGWEIRTVVGTALGTGARMSVAFIWKEI